MPLQYPELVVDVTRGGAVESRHQVSAVLRLSSTDRTIAFGDAATATFWRSAYKPFQAVTVVEHGVLEAGGLGLPDLAVVCASHGGTELHLARVSAILDAADASEADLRCGPHEPYDESSARRLQRTGEAPGRLHNNCSGKHAAMLGLARHRGWPRADYWKFEHPVQEQGRKTLSAWFDGDPGALVWATDGCGLPTPLMSLADMAEAYARLARRAAQGEAAPAAVVEAMTSHPELTSSEGREPLLVMQATEGRILAKEGAEGVLCLASADGAWGLALKVRDGARRAVGPAAAATLERSGVLSAEDLTALRALGEIPLSSTTDERIGFIRPRSE